MRYILTVAAVFTGELFLKNRVEKDVKENSSKKICGGAVILTKHHNRGAFLNTGERKPALVRLLSLLLTAAATVLFLCSFGMAGKGLLKWGLSLLLGGAFSNTFDRMKRGYVVDYFRLNVPFQPLGRIIFNISDFCIIIGAAMAALDR